ncbi:Endoglucanase precursor [compost metagenome]
MNFSTDNGLNWHDVLDLKFDGYFGTFRLPIDPQVTNVWFRIMTKYSPLIGGNSYPEKIAGPFPIKQPGEVSELTATANDDGSVTLTWLDNSNMESQYVIKRVGPEGTRYFYVQNSSEFGPLTSVDKTTSRYKNTFYAYSVTPLIDKYDLPDIVKPGIETVFVINKAPLDGVKIIDEIESVIKIDPQVGAITNNGKLSGVITDLKPVEGIKLPDLFRPVGKPDNGNGKPGGATGGTQNEAGQTIESMLEETVKEASDWAKAELKLAIAQSLTTSSVLGDYQKPITREHFAGIAVKLYEALSSQKAEVIAPNPFKDTVSIDVLKANKLGIVNGISADTFSPNTTITRQELCVMLMRAVKAAKPAASLQTVSNSSFNDANQIASWALDALHFAVNHKIMNGVGENRVDPLGNTTREQAIVVVKRTFDAFK